MMIAATTIRATIRPIMSPDGREDGGEDGGEDGAEGSGSEKVPTLLVNSVSGTCGVFTVTYVV